MIKKLFPILLTLIGISGGVAAGLVLKPEHVEKVEINPCGENDHAQPEKVHSDAEGMHAAEPEYVKLNNQFVIPVVVKEMVDSMVVMSLSIEIDSGQTETVYKREPKLRDAFLQVLFDHANMGGFQGEFTNSNNMDVLRTMLLEVAQSIIGTAVISVLVTNIARQDV